MLDRLGLNDTGIVAQHIGAGVAGRSSQAHIGRIGGQHARQRRAGVTQLAHGHGARGVIGLVHTCGTSHSQCFLLHRHSVTAVERQVVVAEYGAVHRRAVAVAEAGRARARIGAVEYTRGAYGEVLRPHHAIDAGRTDRHSGVAVVGLAGDHRGDTHTLRCDAA